MTIRHDAAKGREHAKSELIRHSLEIFTPEEQAAKERAEEARRQAQAKTSAKGSPLFPEG